MDKNKLFIANLPWVFTADSLRDLFSQFGEITQAEVIVERVTGRSKGFGFVTFANEQDAQKAIEGLHGKEVDGRKLVVNVARPREERGSKGGAKRFSFEGRNRNRRG